MRALPDAQYGEAKEFATAQQGAPMAATPGPTAAAPQAPGSNPAADVVGLGTPSQRPGEPVTAGADAGLGPGMSSLGIKDPNKEDIVNLKRVLPALELIASMPHSSQATRNVVRRLRSLSD